MSRLVGQPRALKLLSERDPTMAFAAMAARYRADDDLEALSLLSSKVDGARLVKLVQQWGVAGLVSETLERLPLDAIEQRWRREIIAARLQALVSNRRAMDVLAKLCGEATRRGLPLVPLKGAALMLGRPYDQLDLRSMVDVDVVGRPADLAPLADLMGEHGFERSPDFAHLLRHHHHVSFFQASPTPLLLELHWSPFNALHCHSADQRAMQRLVTHRCNDVEINVFDAEDTLLSLLTHIATHRYHGPLKWLVDVDAVLRLLSLRQDVFWSRAAAIGGRGAVHHALGIVSDHYGIPFALPVAPLRARLLDKLSPTEAFGDDAADGALSGVMIHLLSHDRARDALRHVVFKASELAERHVGLRWHDRLVRGPVSDGSFVKR